MIVTKLQGGLGNQMFQYAIGRHLAYLNDAELKLDISFYNNQSKNDTPRRYALDVFNIVESFSTIEDIKKNGLPNMVSKNIFLRIYRKFFRNLEIKKPLRERTFVNEPYFDFCSDILKIKRSVYLSGNWQNEKYFYDIADILHKDFTIKNISSNYKQVNQQISNSKNSVSLHIRRGDYVHNENTNKYHGVCSLKYYSDAVNSIAKKINAPIFFIFSDDMEWVKKNLKIDFPIVFVSNDKLKDYEELILMSKCKHNIIANSSFSWWSAWLNNNPNKIVIAPKKWFQDPKRAHDNPCPENWIKI